MILLVGLGNPGAEYKHTRHNAGFKALDAITGHYGFSKAQKKFHGELSEGEVARQKLLALKPMTMMNRSGVAVQEAVRFFKIPLSNVIVFYDELDLVPGKVRVKIGGSDGGHNGIKSLDSHVSKEYVRVRIGIGHPGHKDQVHDYVLSNFSKPEKAINEATCAAIVEALPLLLKEDREGFMTKVALLAPVEKNK